VNCKLEKWCRKELAFELPIPDRCAMCTDLVKHIVSTLKGMTEKEGFKSRLSTWIKKIL
jgi:hypothetical protein